MIKLELYTGEKDYVTPSGVLYDKAKVLEEFPSALTVPFVVETNSKGRIIFGMSALDTLCSVYGVDDELSDEEAVMALEVIRNTPEVVNTTPSAEERIAAALEYQVLASLPDEEDTSSDNSESEVV